MAVDTNVLVVGAGPIGLVNAWGMKHLNPNLKIVVLEKYAKYQRSHTLIMQAAQLEAIMKATNSEQDPTLVALLDQLKKDPHIRTNTLQETFTKLAKEIGVEIKTENEVYADTIEAMIATEYPNVDLIIGADGTHSIVSETLFPKGNQVKHEFDFVLQLRFDIKGEEKAPGIRIERFYQQMARKGLIANEYVGNIENGKTPVTMQMMISKEDFLALQKATSKDPLRPYVNFNGTLNEGSQQQTAPQLPKRLKSFLTHYLKEKIEDTREVRQEILNDSVRISVNEAPATHAKQVVHKKGETSIILKGDSGLGLSYFKGLNAGLEASAQFLTDLFSSIKDSFKDKKALETQLATYQTWFLNDFAPKKVKEVEEYSFWRIRSFMGIMQVVRDIKWASMADEDDDLDPAIRDYFAYYTYDPLSKNKSWQLFPHRDYDPPKFGQFSYVPLTHTLKKIAKNFIDYFKPYKSKAQVIQDFKMPLVGTAHLFLGLAKTVIGIFTFNLGILADGLLTFLRGAIEVASLSLLLLKLFSRVIATTIHGDYKKIEEGQGIQNLADYGLNKLNKVEDVNLKEDKTIYELLAVCNDMHRKFHKSVSRGEATQIEVEEYRSYFDIRADNVLDRQKLIHYFSLFAHKNVQAKVSEIAETLQQNL
ncbi:MAG: hypothetical protein LCH30_07995 [Proteobacteria bacterium]|nr:hypothetical protein [Pseudomonadota bacterium]